MRKVVIGYVVISAGFWGLRVATEVAQRRAVCPGVGKQFLALVDAYCAPEDIEWKPFLPGYFHTKYHYWSRFDSLVILCEDGKELARLGADFEARWFGVYLVKVEMARPAHFTPFIDVTDDFLSAKLQHPKVYFEENPLPEPEETYLPHDAEMEDMVTYLIKKGQEAEAKHKSSETDADRRRRRIENTAAIGMILAGAVLAGWIVWGSIYVWYLFVRTRSYVSWSVRWKSYLWLVVLPLVVGIHIVSLVLGDPFSSPVPEGFWVVYVTNELLVLVGVVFYQVLVVRVMRRYRGIRRGWGEAQSAQQEMRSNS